MNTYETELAVQQGVLGYKSEAEYKLVAASALIREGVSGLRHDNTVALVRDASGKRRPATVQGVSDKVLAVLADTLEDEQANITDRGASDDCGAYHGHAGVHAQLVAGVTSASTAYRLLATGSILGQLQDLGGDMFNVSILARWNGRELDAVKQAEAHASVQQAVDKAAFPYLYKHNGQRADVNKAGRHGTQAYNAARKRIES